MKSLTEKMTYKKDQRELAQQQKIAEKKEQLNKENKNTKKVPITIKEDIKMIYNDDFESIILSLRIIIISLFCVYIIYSVLYYIFLKKAFNRLKLLVSYSSINASIDNYLYDSIIAMEYIHMTNSSSQDLSLIISDKDSDYVNAAINSFYSFIEDKEYFESMHGSLFPSLKKVVNLNMSENQIEDKFFKEAVTSLNGDYCKFITSLSKGFPVMIYGSDNTLLKEILYLLNQKYNKFSQCEFSEMFSLTGRKEDYDLYTLVLMTVRIIRTYFNETLLSKDVDKVFNYFSAMIIGYLVINLFLEVTIFLILNFFVISRIKVLNRKVMKFIYSLRF